MFPYLITFSLSLIAYWFATKPLKKNLRVICLLLVILPPSLLAGFRDASLGIDWRGYGIDVWNFATHAGSVGYALDQFPSIEPGYKLLNYAVGLVSSDYHVFFFVHQLILVSVAVAVAYKKRMYGHSEIILVFYFFYIFNTSINIIRQSFALIICLLMFSLWDSQLRKRSFACLGLAGLFHVSAVFASFTFFLSICKKIPRKKIMVIATLVFIAVYKAVDSFTYILTKLIQLNVFSWHYIGYADQIGSVYIHKTEVVFQIGIILLTYLFPLKNKNERTCAQIFFFALTAIALNMFGNITDIAFRVAHYFILPIAILMPRISYSSRENQKACLFFSLLLLVRFFYFAYSNGLENTVPYKSALLGI